MAMNPILDKLLEDYALHLRRRGRTSVRLRAEGNIEGADSILDKIRQELVDETNPDILHWIIFHMATQEEDIPNAQKRKS